MTEAVHNIDTREPYLKKFLVFQKLYPLCSLLWLNYSVTLAIFPAVAFAAGLGLSEKVGLPLIVLIFNLFDTIGKYAYKYRDVADSYRFYTFGFLRALV